MHAVPLPRRGRRPLAFAFLALSLAACGGGDDDAVQPSSPAATTPAVSAPAKAALASGAAAAASARRIDKNTRTLVKWRPGHYVTLLPGSAPRLAYMQRVIGELQANPALRGLQIRYTWAELEPVRGVYDFSRVERDLELLAAVDKRLFILLQTKSFDASSPAPAYLDTDLPDGGTYAFAKTRVVEGVAPRIAGHNIRLWSAEVRDRLSALTLALGKRFNSHPALEGLAMTETALGFPLTPIPRPQVDAFFANLLQVHGRLREAFPNTVTLQFANYPTNQLPTFVPGLRDAAAGLGGPDTFVDNIGLEGGVYPYYRQFAGVVPLAPSVQYENYFARTHGGAYDPPSIDEIYQFARNRLKANYLFWSRYANPGRNTWANVLEYMNDASFAPDAAGGLAAECPRVYDGCVDRLGQAPQAKPLSP